MNETTLTSFTDVHDALCNPGLRQSLYDAGEIIMKDVLLTLHGEAHKKRRHLELRLFRRNYAHFYESDVFPATLKSTLDPMASAGELDLVEFGYRVTMALTADFAGIDRPIGDAAATDRLLSIVKTFSEGATLVHSERPHEDVIAEVRSASEVFQDFLRPSWEKREALINRYERGEIPEQDLPRDVLTVLLRNRATLPDDIIAREIGFYLQAGSHSTANSMVQAAHEIFQSGADLKLLQRDRVRLQRYVHESLRLHPASPVAWRKPVENLTLSNGQQVTPADLLVLDIHAANRDTSVFGIDANLFDPDREIRRPKVGPYGLTFGAGVHMCTGRDLDGGVPVPPGLAVDQHQYGIVTLLVAALLDRGMVPHPHKAAEKDRKTSRDNWGFYPVAFNAC